MSYEGTALPMSYAGVKSLYEILLLKYSLGSLVVIITYFHTK